MAKFNIGVTHLEHTNFLIDADTWREAVEIASDKADEAGLETAGGFHVADAKMKPVDTFAE